MSPPDNTTNTLSAKDALGRELHDLRVSVTDRCNFRCVYCMPKEVFGRGYKFLAKKELLTFEEIEKIVKVFSRIGVKKIRLTGGEPLVRSELESLIEKIANIDGIHDISLTTNAALLSPARASSLRSAGLNRVNVSLDAIDDATFMAVNDVGIPVQKVLEHSVLPMARYFHGTGQILRFIEFMDVGNTNRWQDNAVMHSEEIISLISAEMPLEPVSPNYRGEVAKRWRYQDGGGEIGVISSVSQPFCGDCSRARLSAVGKIYTCLFAADGFDLLALLRTGVSESELESRIRKLWGRRRDRYSETRTTETVLKPKVEMSYIGG